MIRNIVILSTMALSLSASYSSAAVLVLNQDGTYVSKQSISAANTDADAAGKTIIITSPQTLTGDVALAQDREWRFEKGGYINLNGHTFTGLKVATPDMFGVNTTPGITDMTVAVQAAFDAVFLTGGELVIPPSIYRITSMVGVNTTLTIAGQGFPTIRGTKAMAVTNNLAAGKIQDGSILLYDNNDGTALGIVNASARNLFYGGVIRDLAIVKKNSDRPTDGSIGLSIKGAVDWRLYNVVITGFDIGFKNFESYSWDAYGLTCVRNNIGVLLDKNSNAVGIHGAQLHQNKVNLKIKAGTNILIAKANIEGEKSHGVIISGDGTVPVPSNITLLNLYAEDNSIDAIRIGFDESDSVSQNSINNITIINPTFNLTTGIVPIQLDKTNNIIISQPKNTMP